MEIRRPRCRLTRRRRCCFNEAATNRPRRLTIDSDPDHGEVYQTFNEAAIDHEDTRAEDSQAVLNTGCFSEDAIAIDHGDRKGPRQFRASRGVRFNEAGIDCLDAQLRAQSDTANNTLQ